MDQKLRDQLSAISEESITNKFLNVVSKEQLEHCIDAFRIIKVLANIDPEIQLPRWFTMSLDHATTLFVNMFANGGATRMGDFVAGFVFGKNNNLNGEGLLYSLPMLMNWFEVRHLVNNNLKELNYNESESNRDKEFENLAQSLAERTEEFDKLQAELNNSLAVINKAVGKIAVKEYAEIFDDQAKEHSTPFKFRRKWPPILAGKAQKWIITGVILLVALVLLILNIDMLIDITGDLWSPTVLVHLLSRTLLISLIIFFISFSFKQYRVNMHLYTVNKHRANTLKSFEYLTKAPDKLEAASYNAILMEVAKSIYESGQTGYITTTETHGDMPSIIDMTKVITSTK